jgi:hypothetical protein
MGEQVDMTKREWLVGMIAKGLCANPNVVPHPSAWDREDVVHNVSRGSELMADAILADQHKPGTYEYEDAKNAARGIQGRLAWITRTLKAAGEGEKNCGRTPDKGGQDGE